MPFISRCSNDYEIVSSALYYTVNRPTSDLKHSREYDAKSVVSHSYYCNIIIYNYNNYYNNNYIIIIIIIIYNLDTCGKPYHYINTYWSNFNQLCNVIVVNNKLLLIK